MAKEIINEIPPTWTNSKLINLIANPRGGANIKSNEYVQTGTPVVLKTDVQPYGLSSSSEKYISNTVAQRKYGNKTLSGLRALCCRRTAFIA